MIEVTDSSVTLEFLPSNATSSRYYVLYRPQSALDGTAYTYGAYINDDGRQAPMKYRVIQERILANTEYSFKIAPSIRVGATYHHTSESPVICVKTRERGKNQIVSKLIDFALYDKTIWKHFTCFVYIQNVNKHLKGHCARNSLQSVLLAICKLSTKDDQFNSVHVKAQSHIKTELNYPVLSP